jgi:hypothetical protein
MHRVWIGRDVTSQLYTEDGVEITTHSMIKQFGRCERSTFYKYVQRLKKRAATKRDVPLRRGTWMHKLLEEHYAGRDWKVMHRKLSQAFGELFDEERDALGDLPRECATLMRSYLWHYGANKEDRFHGWDVQATELTLECPWPDGEGIYRGRVDVLVRDQWGLWIVDHKTHKSLPGMTFRLLDFQSALYIWAAWEMGYKVNGFIWNYIRTKTPTTPSLAYVGKPQERLSTAAIDTDWPTYYLGVKALGRLQDPVAVAKLAELKRHRWGGPDSVQTSPFFRREMLEKDTDMLARVVGSAMRTRDAMRAYDWDQTETIERTVDRSCDWCDFNQLCTAELFVGHADNIRRQMFRVGDPMDYYRDDKVETQSSSD